jgi:hypothetical protein
MGDIEVRVSSSRAVVLSAVKAIVKIRSEGEDGAYLACRVPRSLCRYTRCSALEKGSKRVRDVGARENRDSALSAGAWMVYIPMQAIGCVCESKLGLRSGVRNRTRHGDLGPLCSY